MTSIPPLFQNLRMVDENGFPTTEFKRFMDLIQARIGGISGGVYSSLSISGGTTVWDLNNNPIAVIVLTDDTTMPAPLNQTAGIISPYRLTIVQDATGSRTITWNSVYKFPGGTVPTLSTAANAVDEIVFDSDGTNMKMLTFTQNLH